MDAISLKAHSPASHVALTKTFEIDLSVVNNTASDLPPDTRIYALDNGHYKNTSVEVGAVRQRAKVPTELRMTVQLEPHGQSS